MRKQIFFLWFRFCFTLQIQGQNASIYIEKGNKAVKENKLDTAIANYTFALDSCNSLSEKEKCVVLDSLRQIQRRHILSLNEVINKVNSQLMHELIEKAKTEMAE